MWISFDEISGISLGPNRIPVASFAGRFCVDTDGEIVRIILEEWNPKRGQKPREYELGFKCPDGLGVLLWHVLRPILRSEYAEQIVEHYRQSRQPAARWMDEHKIGSFEALGVR